MSWTAGFEIGGYLESLQVDYLKIDGAFVKEIDKDGIDFAMVESIQHIRKVRGLKTIAKSVESEEVLQALHLIRLNFA